MDPMQKTFDRAAEDLGNAIHLEHVNVTIPDQRIASLFYGAGLGLTRDWPKNLLANGRAVLHIGGKNVKVKAHHKYLAKPPKSKRH